ncbi:MAG: SulP family inorganic anion transporter, partial [Planctomycetota bacterium JB042]
MPDLRAYLRDDLRPDLLAGLTVSVMGVPQAMAYAMIAELPPVFGLYTAIVSCAVAALLGSSRHLVTGPTNALCMVLLSLVGPIAADGSHDPVEVVLLLTAMTGVLQLAFGLLRLGGIVRYVSNSVVVGFTVGAGILIGANQLKNILGLDLSGHQTIRFHEVVAATARELPGTNPYAVAIGLVTIAVAVLLPRIDRRIPAALVGVVVAALMAT